MARLYNNMAGRFTELLDGNLGDFTVPETTSVLIIGTADKGPSNTVRVANDRSAMKELYGTGGTLIRGMYEAYGAGAPLVLLWRIGGVPAKVAGIANGGIEVSTKEAKLLIEDEYSLQWLDSTLSVWRVVDSTLVWKGTYANGFFTAETDLGEIEVSIVGTVDTDNAYEITDGATGVVMSELDSGYSVSGLTLTVSDPELDLTRKELYEKLDAAYDALQDFTLHFICPMDVYLDDYNVADIVDLSGGNDPTTYFGTSDYLGFLKVDTDVNGEKTYTWADTQVDDDYHEVNFAYQLADFCFGMTRNELFVHGVINTRPPIDFSPLNVSKWVGIAPVVNTSGTITTNGTGLLGNKFMAGTTSWDAGFWATQSGYLDDPDILTDRNGIQVDIGRYLSIPIDHPVLSNRWAQMARNTANYRAAVAASLAGILSALTPNVAPYANPLPASITPGYSIAKYKLDDLSGQHYMAIRRIPGGYQFYDGPTAARESSDYRRFTTVNIVKYCDSVIRTIAKKYTGIGMDLKARLALKAELDRNFKDIVNAGFLQRFAFQVSQTAQQAVNGQLYIFTELVPAFEARQIFNIIGLKTI